METEKGRVVVGAEAREQTTTGRAKGVERMGADSALYRQAGRKPT
jgi:hypothetical protein